MQIIEAIQITSSEKTRNCPRESTLVFAYFLMKDLRDLMF
jgi:hypothetical protein